jgi:hypothetical protein
MSGIAGDPGDREPPEHFADEEKAMTENDEGAVRRYDMERTDVDGHEMVSDKDGGWVEYVDHHRIVTALRSQLAAAERDRDAHGKAVGTLQVAAVADLALWQERAEKTKAQRDQALTRLGEAEKKVSVLETQNKTMREAFAIADDQSEHSMTQAAIFERQRDAAARRSAEGEKIMAKARERLLFWKDMAERNGYGHQQTCGVVAQIDQFLSRDSAGGKEGKEA